MALQVKGHLPKDNQRAWLQSLKARLCKVPCSFIHHSLIQSPLTALLPPCTAYSTEVEADLDDLIFGPWLAEIRLEVLIHTWWSIQICGDWSVWGALWWASGSGRWKSFCGEINKQKSIYLCIYRSLGTKVCIPHRFPCTCFLKFFIKCTPILKFSYKT